MSHPLVTLVTMQQQHLWFINDEETDWHIDEHTKTIGRQGIQAARATLARCRAIHSETITLAA